MKKYVAALALLFVVSGLVIAADSTSGEFSATSPLRCLATPPPGGRLSRRLERLPHSLGQLIGHERLREESGAGLQCAALDDRVPAVTRHVEHLHAVVTRRKTIE